MTLPDNLTGLLILFSQAMLAGDTKKMSVANETYEITAYKVGSNLVRIDVKEVGK